MLRPASRCLAVVTAAVAAGIFARALMVYWMESIAVVLSEGMTCESPPEVVVGLPCFCPFVTVAGRGGCRRQRWMAAAGWASLVFGLVDVVVSVADVLVGSGRTPMLAWFSTRLEREVGGPGRLGRSVD